MSGRDNRPPPPTGRAWRVIEVVHDIDRIAGEWDALIDRAGGGPFDRPGWYMAWWDAFGDDGRMAVIALRSEGRLCAAVPLARRAGMSSSPTNDHTPRFDLIADDEDALAELARIVLRLRQRRLTISPIAADGPGLAALRTAMDESGYRAVERTVLRSPYLDLAGIEDPGGVLDRKFRKELRRCRRRLEESGELTLDIVRAPDAVDAALQEAFALEALQWKGDAGSAIASSSQTGAFYTAVAGWAAERGSLFLAMLRLDGRAIAFELDILDNGRLYSMKAGFDPEWSRFSPGHLLMLDVLTEGVAHGMRVYELLGDAEPYKLRWTETVRELRLLQASPPGARGTLDHGRTRYVDRAVRGVRRRLPRRSGGGAPGR